MEPKFSTANADFPSVNFRCCVGVCMFFWGNSGTGIYDTILLEIFVNV